MNALVGTAAVIGMVVARPAAASPNPALFKRPDICTASERYRFPDGSVDQIWADNAFEGDRLARAGHDLYRAFDACAAAARTMLRGTLGAKLDVGSDGRVRRVRISGVSSRTVRACVVTAVSALHLPHQQPQDPTDPVHLTCSIDLGPHVRVFVRNTVGLSRVFAAHWFDRHEGRFRRCYESAIRSTNPSGTVTAGVLLDASGSVVRVAASGMSEPRLERCIERVITAVKLPELPSTASLDVLVGFQFYPRAAHPGW